MHRLLSFKLIFCLSILLIADSASAQLYDRITWSKDGNSYYAS